MSNPLSVFWRCFALQLNGRNIYFENYRALSHDIYSAMKLKRNHPIRKILSQKITSTGPITVADFMREALTNPISGYYASKEVFGRSGDFVTAPEISQMFGELVAVWFYNEWRKVGAPKPFNIVELGPGTGSMMRDILRVFYKLKADRDLSVHMVEVSRQLVDIQIQNLDVYSQECNQNELSYKKGKTNHGVPIFWYKSYLDIRIEGYTCILAQEFFDAMPIHKFQKTKNGWREVLIDLNYDEKNSINFCYVLSRFPTPMTKILCCQVDDERNEFEVSSDSIAIMQVVAQRIERYGGTMLVIDYGHCGTKTDTLRAFQKHKQVDPLSNVGEADLTADVDFMALKKAVGDKLTAYGPVTQQQFLKQMYIDIRLESLMKSATEEQKQNLKNSYHILMDDDKMGISFQVIAFFPSVLKNILKKYPPVGFLPNEFQS